MLSSHLVSRSIFKLNNKKRLVQTGSAGASSSVNSREVKDCLFFIRFGKCHKGDACKFTHDPAKVSICTRFLKGTCKSSTCPFSHEVSADKMPLCSYFQKGQCTATACPYRHAYFRKNVPYCLDFINSFCTKGEKCTKQHVLLCTDPDCSRDPKQCPLRHKHLNKTKSASVQKKANSNSRGTVQKTKKRRKNVVVVVSKDTAKEAWPEFVTLTGDNEQMVDAEDDTVEGGQDNIDDDDEGEETEVHLKMPCRVSQSNRRLKRFLERRTRPVWPDYSGPGVSASRVENRELRSLPGYSLRQIVKKARWMRRVPRPVRLPGEFIALEVANDRKNIVGEDGNDLVSRLGRDNLSANCRREWKSNQSRAADYWAEISGDEISDEEDDDVEEGNDESEALLKLSGFNEPVLAAAAALTTTSNRKREGSVDSELSVSSYTSPGSEFSSDENAVLGAADREPTRAEVNDWLLEYLYSLEKSPSPVPEPERLDHYGPIFEHWEFRTGDKIREAIEKFKRRKRAKTAMKSGNCSLPRSSVSTMGASRLGSGDGAGVVVERRPAEDYIPLWSQEEGEILSEDEVEGVDLDVVDMDLDSEAEEGIVGGTGQPRGIPRTSPIPEAEEISSDEETLAAYGSEPEEDSAEVVDRKKVASVEVASLEAIGAEIISDVEYISDVEEGEIF